MKTLYRVCILVFLLAILAAAGWGFRVLVPYYKQKHDDPIKQARRVQAVALLDALYVFSERDPEKRFPTNLSQLSSILRSSYSAAELPILSNDFIYIRPQPHLRSEYDVNKVIIAEKLGHYKYANGGYIGTYGNIVRWHHSTSYNELMLKNGIASN